MIERVIETLTPPEAWTKGHLARSALKHPIGPEASGAVCWCLMGAVTRVAGETYTNSEAYDLLFLAIEELFPKRLAWDDGDDLNVLARLNDHPDTTHADVLRVLARARELELSAS